VAAGDLPKRAREKLVDDMQSHIAFGVPLLAMVYLAIRLRLSRQRPRAAA